MLRINKRCSSRNRSNVGKCYIVLEINATCKFILTKKILEFWAGEKQYRKSFCLAVLEKLLCNTMENCQ